MIFILCDRELSGLSKFISQRKKKYFFRVSFANKYISANWNKRERRSVETRKPCVVCCMFRDLVFKFRFKQYLFCIKYMGKYIQCHVRQDLTLSVKLLPVKLFFFFQAHINA